MEAFHLDAAGADHLMAVEGQMIETHRACRHQTDHTFAVFKTGDVGEGCVAPQSGTHCRVAIEHARGGAKGDVTGRATDAKSVGGDTVELLRLFTVGLRTWDKGHCTDPPQTFEIAGGGLDIHAGHQIFDGHRAF
jgi:hypothetical protein